MKRSPSTLSLAGAIIALALPGAAQQACGGRVKLETIFDRLIQLHDKDKDGKITKKEFKRSDKAFGNHDRNSDGVISQADYPRGRFWNGFGVGIARRADANKNSSVTMAEWKKFLAILDADEDGVMTMKEFMRMAPEVSPKPGIMNLMFDLDGDGTIEAEDFMTLFKDLDLDDNGVLDGKDLKRPRFLGPRPNGPAPRRGEMAPDFELALADKPKQTVKLSSFRGKKPVALIFGSYT